MQPACCGARFKAASCSVHWGSLCVGEASAPSVAATAHLQPPLEVCGVVWLHIGCVAQWLRRRVQAAAAIAVAVRGSKFQVGLGVFTGWGCAG